MEESLLRPRVGQAVTTLRGPGELGGAPRRVGSIGGDVPPYATVLNRDPARGCYHPDLRTASIRVNIPIHRV